MCIVIGANSGGPKDFVTSEVGELVPESDSNQELAEHLAEAIQSSLEEDWKFSKKDACIRVANGYSFANQCERLLQETRKIEEALSEKHRRSSVSDEAENRPRFRVIMMQFLIRLIVVDA